MKTKLFWLALALASATPATAQSRKPVVAIVEIDDLTQGDHAEVLSTMIESAIAGTGKFRVMERQNLAKLVGEQVRAKGGVVTTNRPGQMGGFEGVDYLIYGTITSLAARTSDDAGAKFVAGLLGNKNASCANKVATLALDVKITDAESGEIKYVTRLNETQKSATSCSGSASIDAGALMRSAANRVAGGLVTTIYPIQVASVQSDGSLILNYGEGSIDNGAIMAVFAKGQDIVDPASGDVIGSTDVKLGYVQVSEVLSRMSKARPLTAFAQPAGVGALARLASPDEARQLARTNKRK